MSGKMSYKKEGVLFYSVKNQANGESNRNSMKLAGSQGMSTRKMSDIKGNPN